MANKKPNYLSKKLHANMYQFVDRLEQEGVRFPMVKKELVQWYGKSRTAYFLFLIEGDYNYTLNGIFGDISPVVLLTAMDRARSDGYAVRDEVIAYVGDRLVEEVRAPKLLKVFDRLESWFGERFNFVLEARHD